MNSAERHYTGAGGKVYHESKRGIPREAFPWVARLRAEKLQAHIPPAAVVFEFGAGFGWNLGSLRAGRLLATDLENLLAPELAEKVEFASRVADLQTGLADVVICHHVLEHVLDPPGVLAELRRVLKPSGMLLLFVPFEKESRYRRFDPAEPNHHLYSWNVQTLGNLVCECGFSVQSAGVGRFGYDRFAAKFAVRFRLGENGFRLVRRLAHLIAPALEVRVAARPTPPP